jgi:uncharacterized protein (DUF3820 family)
VRMPFGKYKGYELTDIPQPYLEWLIKQMKERPQDNYDGGLLLSAMVNEAAFRRARNPYKPRIAAKRSAEQANLRAGIEVARTAPQDRPA